MTTMILRQPFKKIILIGAISVSALLSACGSGSDNPLNEPFYVSRYAGMFHGFMSGRRDHVCPFYFSNTSAHPNEKKECEGWLKEFEKYVKADMTEINKEDGKSPPTLTDEDIRDPDFWEAMTKLMRKPADKEWESS